MRYLKYIIPAVLILIVATVLHYILPQVDVVRIVGTEVQRQDDSSTGKTRDVYLIQTQTEDGSNRVYRNEDNWLYFKFDSSNLQTSAKALQAKKAADGKGVFVAVRHYGWRLAIFSTYPNAVGVKEVSRDYVHYPIFNIIVIVLLAALVFFVRRRILRLFGGRRREPAPAPSPAPSNPSPAAPAAPSAAPSSSGSSSKASGDNDVDDWLNTDGKSN